MAYIDTSGLEMLENMAEELAGSGIQLHLAEVKGPVMDRLQDSALCQRLGPEHIYLSTEDAVVRLTGGRENNRG